MKLVRILLTIGLLGGMTMMVGCSYDFHNPTPTESDVQIVGDSVFDLSGEIQTDLKTLTGKMYKDRSVSGAKIAAIQSQLNTAVGRTTLRTVIADGGANDILQGSMDCDTDPLTQGCIDVLDYIGDKMVAMFDTMYSKSPDNCVWLGYYHVKGSEIEKNEAIDSAYSDIYPSIFGTQYTGFKATLVDPRSSIVDSDIKSDDIHPTSSGSQKLANLIYNTMKSGGMYY